METEGHKISGGFRELFDRTGPNLKFCLWLLLKSGDPGLPFAVAGMKGRVNSVNTRGWLGIYDCYDQTDENEPYFWFMKTGGFRNRFGI